MEKYSERFSDIVILELDTEGFEQLSDKQKKLAYYLSQAGLSGRAISLDQGSKYNLPFLNALTALYSKISKKYMLSKEIESSLFILFSHNGIYHSTSGEKLTLPLTLDNLESYKSNEPELIETIKNIWFSDTIPQFRTVQRDGVDVIRESGGNFYSNLTTEEVKQFREETYPTGDELPPFGFNERLLKNNDGTISREVISENGLYGRYVKNIMANLTLALEFVENDQQHQSISTLIDCYRTGDAADFDRHCIAWTKDQSSDVYFINGLIESYEDPLGIGCTFESVVAFKNPLQTAKVNKIIDNIQWFENNLPFDSRFKKDKAVGLSASSINVISMAGETAPSLPLGINLPNSDWIRSKHGSKSVSLANVSSSRSAYEVQLREALFLKKYHGVLKNYAHMTSGLHTDLHEIAGHGSGKVLEGVNTDTLGIYYSTIEEARADLVALYYMGDEQLKTFGVYDNSVIVRDAALAEYVSYLTNGAIGQLRRVDLGNDLTQAHFRNRQLIALWILDNCDPTKVSMVEENGNHYIQVNDVLYLKGMFGTLLGIVQRIKSTGDLEGAKELVLTYGTKVNQEIHAKLLERINVLNMPKVVGFMTPMLVEQDNTVIIEKVNTSDSFVEKQLALHRQYVA